MSEIFFDTSESFGRRLEMAEGCWDLYFDPASEHVEAIMADDEERSRILIRQYVREELELSLVSRSRNLIRSATPSSANVLSNTFSDQMGQESASRPSRPAFKRPNIAHHWNRQERKSKQEKSKNVQSIPKTVWLLERPVEDVSCDGGNSFTEDSVLVRAEIDLMSDQNEEEIRGE